MDDWDDYLRKVVVKVFHRDFAALQSRHIHEFRLEGNVCEDNFLCPFHVEKRAAQVGYAYHVAVFGEDRYQMDAVAVAILGAMAFPTAKEIYKKITE